MRTRAAMAGPGRNPAPAAAADPQGWKPEPRGRRGLAPQRVTQSVLLALGTLALEQLLTGTSAHAQACSPSSNPPAPAPITYTVPAGTYSNDSTPAFLTTTIGTPGCNGPATPGGGNPGGTGLPGVAGAGIVATGSGVSLSGSFVIVNPFLDKSVSYRVGGYLLSQGGIGGIGGAGDAGEDDNGGLGGRGGGGGSIRAAFSGSIVPSARSPTTDFGFWLLSLGGSGGAGGIQSGSGLYEKSGGNAGDAAPGSSVTLTAGGTIQATVPVLAQSVGGNGGRGGYGESTYISGAASTSGNGGAGGKGGTVSVEWTQGQITATAGLSRPTAISASSDGGNAGNGENAGPSYIDSTGGNGGKGGDGGSATVTMRGGALTVVGGGAPLPSIPVGISVTSNGGLGGMGGKPTNGTQYAGSGGGGGAGGAASATVLGTITLTTPPQADGLSGTGVLVQSSGGFGGAGAGAAGRGSAGGGGFAGAGGSASLTIGSSTTQGSITASGYFVQGAVVQSIGGGGGDAGATAWGSWGADGGAGADGAAATLAAPNAKVTSSGTGSSAAVVQSIGGGGGLGGDVTDYSIGPVPALAIGGQGGNGGRGGQVDVKLGSGLFQQIGTDGSGGILAQSIGGGGGAAGSASAKTAGSFAIAIGGKGGDGGSAGPVTVSNGALIATSGDHAAGLAAQSVGGGGGKGGAGVALSGSLVVSTSVALGGNGGSGGTGGAVGLSNTGQIITYGADAPGVVLQSIGGGGGAGGAAAARAVSFSPDPDVPAISVAVSTGGRGGTGDDAGKVGLANAGLITTQGDGAIGVIAQSIGGGGGLGGDSTGSAYAGGGSSSASVSAVVVMGGTGGTGGAGGAVTLTNSGVIATLGQDAYGVFAQSIGGGGGAGGAGDASSTTTKAKGSVSAAITIGGSGGSGGVAGTASLTNTGAVTTRGDGADAVFVQSVGGGGGAGGGGVTTASGSKLASATTVGGNGGSGNDGNTATVRNGGSIVTRGTDAIGLSVQSIGGGGGKGGKAGATAGGSTPLGDGNNLAKILSGGLGLDQKVQDLGNDLFQIGQDGATILATAAQLEKMLTQPQLAASEIGTVTQLSAAVTVGGLGGAGGRGGTAQATNTGSITTFGAQSDGIYAQSVGGGGGSGGSATSTTKAQTNEPAQATIGVGGIAGAGSEGGAVTVTNGAGGAILTQGVAAFGIFAQSVGGGGGEGAMAGSTNGSLKSLGITVGGNGGKGGAGGAVTVVNGDQAGPGTITTTGKHGIGILAQSIGGGGGLARTMTTDQTFDPAKIASNPQGALSDTHGVSVRLGGVSGSGGNGGAVTVVTGSAITTSGLDAHAIVAQSVGGGGGIAVGGQLLPAESVGVGNSGNGGAVAVSLNPGAAVSTAGAGAVGLLAQSVGGGGGIGGDFSAVTRYVGYQETRLFTAPASYISDGGAVSVGLSGASVRTTGGHAPAIFAQSIGGGGGIYAYKPSPDGSAVNLADGSVGGYGAGSTVAVTLANSQVAATGTGSAGILAQSDGLSAGAITITIDAASVVRGGAPEPGNAAGQPVTQRDAAAIRLRGGIANRIDNAGRIEAVGDPATAYAILTATPGGTTLTNTGTIIGNVAIQGAAGSVAVGSASVQGGTGNVIDNRPGGVVSAPAAIDLGGGTFRNAGLLHVGGIGTTGTTSLTGDLLQSSGGRLRIDLDPARGQADLLRISGRAELDGAVEINPISLRKGSSGPIVTAAGGLARAPVLQATAGPVFTYSSLLTGNSLSLVADADFKGGDPAKSSNQRGVAGAFQRAWDAGAPGLDQAFLALSRLSGDGAYTRALDSLSGEAQASAISAQLQTAFFVQETLLDHMRFGDAVSGGFGLGGAVGSRFSPGTTLPAAYAADLPGRAFPSSVPVQPVAPGYALWGQAFGGFGETRQNGNAARLGRQTGGFVLGAETGAGALADWRIGVAAGYSFTSFDVAARQSTGQVESGFGAVYAHGALGPVQLRLGAAYAGNALDTRRAVQVPGLAGLASGRTGGDTVQGFGEVGYRIGVAGGYLEPFAGAAAIRIRRDGFTETGGAAALTVFGRSYEVETVTAGLQGQVSLAGLIGADLPVVARGLIGYRRAFGDVVPQALLAFSNGGPAFLTAGVPIARNAVVASAGLDVQVAPRVTIGVNYTGQAGDRAQDHAFRGVLSYRW
ncbi:Uncharacterized conserved protein, contains a C-terminal beta-barrel porin domain [Methylobacterium sp. 174MFSha1.1]|uniref:autotransporter outer membrane beta-barrel domain-containing protein n=1 Tax=Methylobacterium sp. 174MFSha1.1 TaxID=1502749 RepID=UPI0008EA46BB|nr:autotransporter outer membrane beta-barrel domain-containing protein [Methylobacterium sp. 174MFSha1.1]SFV17196.1 Uncharacterized conserved protein, contains a C-terminal beta-barrel porin domain [Methylobacterium sp. 174MFSha1.1]